MSFYTPLKATGLGLFSASTLLATSINLPITIRDFGGHGQSPLPVGIKHHPDFQTKAVIADVGIVQPTLGLDSKPVYAGGVHPSVSSAASFSTWYNASVAYNTTLPSFPQSLSLAETGAASHLFEYNNTAFFPIDGLGFGDFNASGHNYHFTLELHTQFTYRTGLSLDFAADDDLWVFINGKLVVDLGGVHPSATVDDLSLSALGLVAGQDYHYDLFYAERRTTAATLKFQVPELRAQAGPTGPTVPEAEALIPVAALGGISGFMAWRRRQKRA